MTEKARKIFDILGLEPVEEFRFVKDGMICRFSDDLTLQCRISDRYFEEVENVDTYRKILNGEVNIIKIPKPTKEDEIVIAYAKLCGCKWIAKDRCGVIWGYGERPYKKNDNWIIDENDEIRCYLQLFHPISFLSWEDEEPYYIGE